MRRLAFVVTLLVAAAGDAKRGDGRFDRINSRCIGGRTDRGLPCDSYAFFEFAPTNGAGMGAACACSAVTGAKGEAVTFTRTGSATCSRQGLATTGIANGDLVSCGGNLPRVEPSGGVLGLRVEGSRTNSCLRSEEIDNAVWAKVGGGGAAAPTVTANFAVAPDGATTAERMEFPGTTSIQDSVAFQTACPVGASSASVYLRGNGTSGTLDLAINLNGSYVCSSCSFVPDSWTRCSVSGTVATSTGNMIVGNEGAISGAGCSVGSRSAADVLVWGAQCEAGAYATSYIPTVAASVTRNDELAQASIVGPGLQVGSLSVRTDTIRASGGYPTPLALSTLSAVPASGADQRVIYSNGTSGSTFQCYAGNSTPTLFSTGAAAFTPPQTGVHSYWCASTGVGGTLSGAVDGNSFAASGSMSGSFGAEGFVTIGSSNNVITYVDTIVSRVCRDPDPTRCR